jgi:nitrilase
METLKNFKVAVVQASPVLFDKAKTIEKIRVLTKEAAEKGAKLVAFPESFIPAYPRGQTFGAVIGTRTEEGRQEYLRYVESSIQIPSPDITTLEGIAKANNVYLVIGVTERDGGSLYCTVIFFSPEGKYMGKHRKLMPTAAERVVWGQGDGSTLPVYDTPLGKIGAVICWENYMPLLRTTMYGKGIQVYLALTADGRESWLSTVRHIAMEGRCFVLSCNQFVKRSDYIAQNVELGGTYDKDPNTIVSFGGSCIISPMGQVLAGPNYEGECILTADINLDEIIKGNLVFDAVGHYSRPDVFTLYVDETPRSNLVRTGTVVATGGNTQQLVNGESSKKSQESFAAVESKKFGYLH